MNLADFLALKGRLSDILTHVVIKKSKGRSFFKKVKTTALDFAVINVAIAYIDGNYRIAIGSRPSLRLWRVKTMESVNNKKKLSKEKFLKPPR
jgi:CO/xanthine dehydrogenase FAD-binding subunit